MYIFLLIYASLDAAFTRKVELLRWGTGAYEVKQRLGFELEQNNNSVLAGTNQLTRFLSRMAASGIYMLTRHRSICHHSTHGRYILYRLIPF